ncbi:hypothetical protein LTR48_000527 [Friedmanniomyces endolithicus]|uniref:Uncharacterized protein n=1 Tax=Rachicladosporium monterosium TaxID=1507873 RepID=A0ABR0LBX9_9PEZI|nr:hypothetical protein LTR29_011733 [Friedmanniomyces endolithicus]KAK1094328.1 hypothetical protein LTR48_000527 [Friedmanniomyces endolithicus]KAK5146548.1 hypothetical protein LTR32_001875 [Rachicladosporium monterosium]
MVPPLFRNPTVLCQALARGSRSHSQHISKKASSRIQHLGQKAENRSFRLTRTSGSPARQRFLPFSTGRHHYERGATRKAAVGTEPGLPIEYEGTRPLDRAVEADSDDAEIRIIDYSASRIARKDVPASELQSYLQSHSKPSWATCRWLYVNGISKNVVHTLGQAYGLHQLTLEDVLNTDNLAKIDWYDDHYFLEMTLQRLVDVVEDEPTQQHDITLHPMPKKRYSYTASGSKDADLARQLDKPGRHVYESFDMSVEQVSIFLTADNTIITIFERSGEDIFEPIFGRLQSPHTILRSSDDPSMLVQGTIDAVVDLSVPVGKAFEDTFTELELAVLTKPSITLSRQVYVLRAGLASFLDLLVPISSLVRALHDHRNLPEQPEGTPSVDFARRAVSPLTQAYLKDVQDHITTLTSSTRMRIRSAENLTSLIFNTIAAKQNESVRQLTVVSIFFLPLTFLTGYFGMNFDPMPVVQEHSDTFFWWIASPVMGMTLAILMTRPALRKLAEVTQRPWRIGRRRGVRRP